MLYTKKSRAGKDEASYNLEKKNWKKVKRAHLYMAVKNCKQVEGVRTVLKQGGGKNKGGNR